MVSTGVISLASPAVPGRKDFTRSDSDNWRTLREEQEDEEGADPGGSWRLAVSRRDGTHTDFVTHTLNEFHLTAP